MAGRVCQRCGSRSAALLRGFNGAKDLVLCSSCRRDQLHPLQDLSRPQDTPIPKEGPCWVLAGRPYVAGRPGLQAADPKRLGR